MQCSPCWFRLYQALNGHTHCAGSLFIGSATHFQPKYEQTLLCTCLSAECKFSPAVPQRPHGWQRAQAPGTLRWPHTWEKPPIQQQTGAPSALLPWGSSWIISTLVRDSGLLADADRGAVGDLKCRCDEVQSAARFGEDGYDWIGGIHTWHYVTANSWAWLHGHNFAYNYISSFWSYTSFLSKVNHAVRICFSNALIFNYDIIDPQRMYYWITYQHPS